MHILINLHGTWWDQPPKCRVCVNHQEYFNGSVETIQKINCQVDESAINQGLLEIIMYGKNDSQTLVQDGTIIKDQLLHIDKIVIDDIDLEHLIFSHGIYLPEYPDHIKEDMPIIQKYIDTMGWNGIWKLDFDIPFDIWYLENLP